MASMFTSPLAGFSIRDELDALNPTSVFAPGTLVVTSAPPGADTSQTIANGGAAGTGVLDVRALSLPNLGDVVVVETESGRVRVMEELLEMLARG